MKYRVRVGETDHEVEVTPLGDGRFQVTTAGQTYEVSLQKGGPDGAPLYSLVLEGETVNFHAHGSAGSLEVLLGGELFRTEVARGGGANPRSGGAEGPLSIRAAMPGLVREVYVQPDQTVERGTRLLVLEAMKMNNEVRAPRSGVVQEVKVAPGQRVEKDEVLVVIT